MSNKLNKLKPEIEQAEIGFYKAVLRYLLEPPENTTDDRAPISAVCDAVITYRSALEKLDDYLASIHPNQQPVKRPAIENAIAKVRQRNFVLDTILLRARRRLSNEGAATAPPGR